MEYILADINSTGLDAYWYARSIPSLDLAFIKAEQYPKAKYIIEYRSDLRTKGILPTGKSWPVNSKIEE